MPTINKKSVLVVSATKERKNERMKYYNNPQWRNLRKIYLIEHPLCEECLKHGVVTGERLTVHHILSPFEYGLDELERYRRLLSYENLQTLCEKCHGVLHATMQKEEKKSKMEVKT